MSSPSVVLDTNVGVVAAEASLPLASDIPVGLKTWCVERVNDVVTGSVRITLDDANEMLSEYQENCVVSQFGVKFVKWLWQNAWNAEHVSRVDVPIKNGNYVHFPSDERLNEFDRADRKFVAVSVADPEHPVVLEATDGKWLKWSKALSDHGVQVIFGDKTYAKALCRKKNGCDGNCETCNG